MSKIELGFGPRQWENGIAVQGDGEDKGEVGKGRLSRWCRYDTQGWVFDKLDLESLLDI